MADDTPPEMPVLLAGAPLGDVALERTLGRVAEQQQTRPRRSPSACASGCTPPAALQSRAAIPRRSSARRRPRPNRRRALAAAAAFAAAAAAVWALAPRPALLPPLPAISRTLPADAPVRLRAPDGAGRAGADRRRPATLAAAWSCATAPRSPTARTRRRTLELPRGFMRVVGRSACRRAGRPPGARRRGRLGHRVRARPHHRRRNEHAQALADPHQRRFGSRLDPRRARQPGARRLQPG